MNVNQWINLLASVTLIEMMATIGLGVTLAELVPVAKNRSLLLRALVANYIIVPAAAVGLLLLFRANAMVAAGILVAAVCPGAPYGPPFTALAKGNVAVAVGLMVVLAGSSALLAPLMLRFLLPIIAGDQELSVNAGKMVLTLALTQFLPLSAGLFVCQRNPALAAKLKKPAARLCSLLNLSLLGLILFAQFDFLAQIHLVGYFGMLMLVSAGLIGGWLCGGAGMEGRTTLAVVTGVRNVGVALVIATTSFAGTAAVTATTAFGLFQTLTVALLALFWGRLHSAESSKVATA